MEQYITYLLTQCGMFGSWSPWSWGRKGSCWMEMPKTDEGLSGTSCWQRHRSAVEPGWSWQFSTLQEPQERVTRMGCFCWGPKIGTIMSVWHRIHTGECHFFQNCGFGFTVLANDARAWSSAIEAFWKKSFQTSTGYVVWLSSEQFISATTLLDVRCLALEKSDKEESQHLSEHMEICLRMAMRQRAKCFSAIHRLHETALPRNRHARWWWNCTGPQRNCPLPEFVQVVS